MRTPLMVMVAALAACAGVASPATAGYDRGFVVKSEDGNFLLRVNVEGQVRFVYGSGKQPAGTDEDENGFVIRRARMDLRGHAVEPGLTYRIRVNADRSNGGLLLEYAYLGYDFAHGWNVKAGQFKPQFVREESVNAFRQLAAERSYVADYFTVDFTEGLEVTNTGGAHRFFLSVHDGSYASATEFNADRTAVAFGGRAEALLAGDWKQFDDFSSWSKDKPGVALGAAVDYEVGEEGSSVEFPDVFKYTFDASLEGGGANLFVAFHRQHFADADTARAGGLPTRLGEANQIAVVAQAGVFVVADRVEVFARDEWIDFDGVYYRNNGAAMQSGSANLASDKLHVATVGTNLYVHGHATKVTLDALVTFDPVAVSNTGAGLVKSGDDGQIVLRGQLQWNF